MKINRRLVAKPFGPESLTHEVFLLDRLIDDQLELERVGQNIVFLKEKGVTLIAREVVGFPVDLQTPFKLIDQTLVERQEDQFQDLQAWLKGPRDDFLEFAFEGKS